MKKYFIVKKTYGNGSVEYIPYKRFIGIPLRIELPNGWLKCSTEESAQQAIDAIRIVKTEII